MKRVIYGHWEWSYMRWQHWIHRLWPLISSHWRLKSKKATLRGCRRATLRSSCVSSDGCCRLSRLSVPMSKTYSTCLMWVWGCVIVPSDATYSIQSVKKRKSRDRRRSCESKERWSSRRRKNWTHERKKLNLLSRKLPRFKKNLQKRSVKSKVW